ncbi:unnamed protein product [Caretta caretta]
MESTSLLETLQYQIDSWDGWNPAAGNREIVGIPVLWLVGESPYPNLTRSPGWNGGKSCESRLSGALKKGTSQEVPMQEGTWHRKVSSYCIDVGPNFCRNRDGKYAMSSRQHKGRTRKLCDTAFNQVSPNGEIIERPWLIYSPSTGCLFCFMCKLFSPNSTSAQAKRGFDSWDHIGRLGDHERSTEHRQALTA